MLLPSVARCARATALAALPALVLASAASALSGVCPDGSIFIVQRADAIPCRGAKQVEPNDIPPLNPEFLPRPYGWEVFNRETDPNNPYNLVDTAAPPALAPPPAPGPLPGGPGVAPAVSAPPRVDVASAPAPGAPALDLALTPQDLRDLAAIIEVRQQRSPATLVRRDAEGRAGLALRLARSAAFEARVGEALARRRVAAGPVLAFEVRADDAADFWGNLTFVQGHLAFHPDTADSAQFGVLEGRLGPLGPGDRLLGYAVLPGHVDLARPLEIYWNDQRFEATLTP